MPTLSIRGASIHYEDEGQGDPTLLLVHGLMLAGESFAQQRRAFRGDHRVVTPDLRGQGRSEMTRVGLDLDSLAADLVALIEALDCGPCHVVGFSMGAFIALRLGARRPDLVRSLTLIGPSAQAEDPAKMTRYRVMILLAGLLGVRPIAGRLMEILFGRTFRTSPDRATELARWRRAVERLPRSIRHAARASAHRASIEHELEAIVAPTLVVSGEEDTAVPGEVARGVHHGIVGSRFVGLPDTGHAVMIEQPERFNTLLRSFLESVR